MKRNLSKFMTLAIAIAMSNTMMAQNRHMWGSINKVSGVSSTIHADSDGKVLLSWRSLPTDDPNATFDIYRNGKKLNTSGIKTTNYVDADASTTSDNNYYVTFTGKKNKIAEYTMTANEVKAGLPYKAIKLYQSTANRVDTFKYVVGDGAVGDLDGDGEPEIVIKRPCSKLMSNFNVDTIARHTMLLEAYKLKTGKFMWRICMGPNTLYGNTQSIAIGDFNGDGKDEVAFHTSEGVIFADGKEIGDVNGDGKTDYRWQGPKAGDHYPKFEPEFLSVVDGTTGTEIARTDYIPIKSSEEWGDNYFKRAHSQRITQGAFGGKNNSIVIIRGCYAKIVAEAWDLDGSKLTRRWRFDTEDEGNHDCAAQGNHNLSVGDVDGDGFDEITYGAMAIDHNGTRLYSTGLGHGDAMHLGKFVPTRDGMQVWSCFETGKTQAALRDAATGEILWSKSADADNDTGRCLVADFDPTSPGCEMWFYKSNVFSADGKDLGYTLPGECCNMAIWFTGSLNRQTMESKGNGIPLKICEYSAKRSDHSNRAVVFTNFGVTTAISTKNNPVVYGDIWGDWREEVVLPTANYDSLLVFTTWMPSDYKLPYLRSDHTYEMSLQNQNVGYNQPNHTGFYLGSDMDTSKLYTSATDMPKVSTDKSIVSPSKDIAYNLQGQRVSLERAKNGIYIVNAKKVVR